ncbi:ATP-dependent nuclease [Pseudorhodoferax soli]|uniref:Putative ATP-dependent endonuclease of OLD family n=1 Tax=Pseudorhodoferax soli TaxID=545864 RepID=A0A368XAU9_9BURK|nr:AAA family ATPase [Pseudorhodoferax soli]RCW65093.1 putative ATP-dependent endonuclease of OLD family [Pseudorhodoferax soli]
MFVSLEDEAGDVQVIIWPTLKERQRTEMLRSKLLAVYGRWQRESGVANLIEQELEDLSPMLGGLSTTSRNFHWLPEAPQGSARLHVLRSIDGLSMFPLRVDKLPPGWVPSHRRPPRGSCRTVKMTTGGRMKLTRLRMCNFQSFGPQPTVIGLEATTYLLGPNGSGKTAVLQALARLFGFDPTLRRIRRTDFHIPPKALASGETVPQSLWLEAQFEFPELRLAVGKHATIPGHFAHMQLASPDGIPRVRFRLMARLDEDGDIEETMHYVVQADAADEPVKTAIVSKHARNAIQVHYLPARRDPKDHVSFAASSLLGRVLRAANWRQEQADISGLTQQIGEALAGNSAVEGLGQQLAAHWAALHKGAYYANPSVSFARDEIDNLLRHLTVGFTPGHDDETVDFSRLSDGQQSLLYISLVLAVQAIGRQALAGESDAFDIDKLRPAVFTLVATEEPENSLSPHYLGRVIKALTGFSGHHDAQAVVATHAPSLLRRVPPENIRYLRLDANRHTAVSLIVLPNAADEAHKFVREAVQSFPELYFSRLVVLGEGDSEEIVLPRLMQAKGLVEDDASIVVAPLGGRHVNHFWRLLNGLGIPHVTLLDLDLGRYQGGWGRVRYAARQLLELGVPIQGLNREYIDALPAWNGDDDVLKSQRGKDVLAWLETWQVFFSSPLDLDFAMLRRYSEAYGVTEDELGAPEPSTLIAVLGKKRHGVEQYNTQHQSYFSAYHKRFKLGSKPAEHLAALADLDDEELLTPMPRRIGRLIEAVKVRLAGLPE